MKSKNVNILEGGTGILIAMSVAVVRCTRMSESQHGITQDNSEAQERAGDDFAHRATSVASVGRLGPAASTGGGSRAGGMGGRESGSNDRRCGGDGNGGNAFFNLVIDPSDEGTQLGAIHVAGEVKLDNPWSGAREVIRSGEVVALIIDHDGVPACASEGEARKIGWARVLTCVAQNRQGERDPRIQ